MPSCGGHPCIWQPVPLLSSLLTLPCVPWRPSRSESRHSLGGPQLSERDSPEFLKRRELMGKSVLALKRLFILSSQFFKDCLEREAFDVIFLYMLFIHKIILIRNQKHFMPKSLTNLNWLYESAGFFFFLLHFKDFCGLFPLNSSILYFKCHGKFFGLFY